MLISTTRLSKPFLVGALLFGALTALRIPLTDPDHVAPLGGYAGLVAVASFWGGICGIVYTLTARWRHSGGMLRWAAYGLMGGILGVLFFALLAADGGHVLGLAGQPIGEWISVLVVSSLILAICMMIARKWFDFIGVFLDE